MKCEGNAHEIFKNVFKQNLVKEKRLKLKPNGVLRLYVNTHKDVNTHINLFLSYILDAFKFINILCFSVCKRLADSLYDLVFLTK